MKSLHEKLTRWALREGSVLGLALFRIVTGLMTIRHLMGYYRDHLGEGYYGAVFHLPYVSWFPPEPGPTLYLALVALGVASGALLVVGWRTRAAAVTGFLAVTTHLALNEIWYRHNRYFLVLSLFLLAFSPCERALSVDALTAGIRPVGPLWTSFLIQAQMTLIYLASATSKVLDGAWRSGNVLAGRGLGSEWQAVAPQALLNLIPPATMVRLLTSKALVIEYTLATLLWFPRTRRFAIWVGVIFHGFIEVRYSVLTFSYLSLATYFVFAEPEPGPRRLVRPRGTGQGWLLPALDWLMQVDRAEHDGGETIYVDHHGAAFRGPWAWIELGAALPPTFLVCWPLTVLRWRSWGRTTAPARPTPLVPDEVSTGGLWVLMPVYLAVELAIHTPGPFRLPHDYNRFVELPIFAALMCTLASTFRRTTLVKA